jgi:hypothetical protein
VVDLADRLVCGAAGSRDWLDIDPDEIHRAVMLAVEAARA